MQNRTRLPTLLPCLTLLTLAISATGQQPTDKTTWAPEIPNDFSAGITSGPDPDCVLRNADSCLRSLFEVEKKGKFGFIDNTGKVAVPIAFTQIYSFSEGLAPMRVGSKFGFVDDSGKIVVAPTWEFVHQFHQGLAVVSNGKKSGFVDRTGKLVIPLQFDAVANFHDGVAEFGIVTQAPSRMYPNRPRIPDEFGYIDTSGRVVIPPAKGNPRYLPVTDGRVPFQVNQKWGAMDTSGKVVIEPQYPAPLEFSNGLAHIIVNGKQGYADTSGKIVVPAIYEREEKFSEGLAAVRTDGRWGFVDTSGQMAIPAQFEMVASFQGGLAAAVTGGKWGIIDKSGKTVIPPQFDEKATCPTAKNSSAIYYPAAPTFYDGLAAVFVHCKWGFIDKTGQAVIPAIYEEVLPFSEGLAAVKSGSKWGFIDKTGQLVIPAQYDQAWSFSTGLARVNVNVKNGFQSSLIDKTGSLIWGPELIKGPSPWLIPLAIPLLVLCPRCIA